MTGASSNIRRATASAFADAIAPAADSEDHVFLAGGSNLIDLMKLEISTPTHVIDIRGVTSDRIVVRPDGGIRIGAAVRNGELAVEMRVRRHYPVLAPALLSGASGQLRNQAFFHPTGVVSRAYGVYQEVAGQTERALFVVDAMGIVRWNRIYPTRLNPRVDSMLTTLETTQAKEARG